MKDYKKIIKKRNFCFAAAMMAVPMFVSGCSHTSEDVGSDHSEIQGEIDESVNDSAQETEKEVTSGTQAPEESMSKEATPTLNGSLRDWGGILTFPSEQQVMEFDKTAVNRSPYLCGWLDIEPEMKFTEYSIDFKADHLAYGTYFSCANIRMDLSSLEQMYNEVSMDSWLSFYAGVQMWEPGKGSGSIMSFWDINCKNEAGELSTVRAELLYPENETATDFDHEGNGVLYLNDYEWKEGCWYRMLLQCGRSEENGHTLVEQWICNLETEEWTQMCCYDTGLTDSCFVGQTAVFLENYLSEYAGDIRTIEYKNIRIHPKDSEQWMPIRQVTMSLESGSGSYAFGADDEQFWMITTGLENCSIQQSEKKGTYQVSTCLNDSPYER